MLIVNPGLKAWAIFNRPLTRTNAAIGAFELFAITSLFIKRRFCHPLTIMNSNLDKLTADAMKLLLRDRVQLPSSGFLAWEFWELRLGRYLGVGSCGVVELTPWRQERSSHRQANQRTTS